jgi:predicted nucleotidyltransferase
LRPSANTGGSHGCTSDGLDPTGVLCRRLRDVLAQRSEVLEAYLFGSRARGDATARSDIDVAVTVQQPTRSGGFGYQAELATELMAALGESRIDVVLLNGADPLLYHRVLRDGVRVWARDLAATTTREGQALSRYCDYVPRLAKIEETARHRMRQGSFGR